jgi:hypothetical protein
MKTAKMNTCTLKQNLVASLCVLIMGIAVTSQAQTQTNVLNGGFEAGTFLSDTTWAGGQAVTLGSSGAGATPVFPNLPFAPWVGGWAPSALRGAYWVDSSAAYEGSKYLYLSGTDVCTNLLYGDGFGLYNNYSGLTPGQSYTFTFMAASAQDLSGGGAATSQIIRMEWSETGIPAGSPTVYNLAANSAWSDTSLSAIPWQQYTFTFTPTVASGVLTLSTDAGAASAVVLDGVQLSPIPEPGGALLVGVSGALFMTRRRRFSRAIG